MSYKNLITVGPGKRAGKACVRDLRITVEEVLEYLASGMTAEEIVSDFPNLTRADVRAMSRWSRRPGMRRSARYILRKGSNSGPSSSWPPMTK